MEHFTHDKVKPADPKAEGLAKAILALMDAEKSLQDAKSKVPRYTGQWDSKDYYAEEQEAWNRAADALCAAKMELSEGGTLMPRMQLKREPALR